MPSHPPETSPNEPPGSAVRPVMAKETPQQPVAAAKTKPAAHEVDPDDLEEEIEEETEHGGKSKKKR